MEEVTLKYLAKEMPKKMFVDVDFFSSSTGRSFFIDKCTVVFNPHKLNMKVMAFDDNGKMTQDDFPMPTHHEQVLRAMCKVAGKSNIIRQMKGMWKKTAHLMT